MGRKGKPSVHGLSTWVRQLQVRFSVRRRSLKGANAKKGTGEVEMSEPMLSAMLEAAANGEEILTSREARSLVKIGRTKLWELTRSGKIPAYRVGEGRTSDLRYKKSELLAWLESNLVNGATLR